jgi:hypothetical protein
MAVCSAVRTVIDTMRHERGARQFFLAAKEKPWGNEALRNVSFFPEQVCCG